MKILYKPFALIIGLVGAKLGQSVFRTLWMRLDDSQPPKPTTAEASAGKVVGAAALEAAPATRGAGRGHPDRAGGWG